MKSEYIEIKELNTEGYLPVISYGGWRLAQLRFCEDLLIENIRTMQKHEETDEVFVLLKGEGMLFTGGRFDRVDDVSCVRLEPLKLYNVKKGVWHNHVISEDATVLIIENDNTSDDNSPVQELNMKEQDMVKLLYEKNRW